MEKIKDISSFNSKNGKTQRLLILLNFIKTKKLALLILENESESLKLLLNSVIKYFYIKKKLKISSSKIENIRNAKKIIFKEWKLDKELNNVFEIFEIENKHKNSSMEILKDNKIIIIDDKNKIFELPIMKLVTFSNQINEIKKRFNEFL